MKYLAIALAVLVIGVVGFAIVKKVSPVGWGWWGTTNTSSGVALRGFDPVAYFTSGSPVSGSDEFTYQWGDATWRFANAENKQRFAEDPRKYAPQFGGFCAFAVSKGFTADPTPEAWHIEDGKLFIFADQNVRDEWVKTLGDGSLDKSEVNWSKR